SIARLTRKYRRGVPELIAWQAELGDELSAGEDGDAALAKARETLERADAAARAAAKELSKKRRAAAKEWSTTLTQELRPLGLPHAAFEFTCEPGDDLGPHGLDRVEMRFTANPGEPARPLAKVASGGELSRVML